MFGSDETLRKWVSSTSFIIAEGRQKNEVRSLQVFAGLLVFTLLDASTNSAGWHPI